MNEVEEEHIREEIKKCDLIADFDGRLACKSELLHKITQFQDIVNLDIMDDFRRTDPTCSRDQRWVPVHIVDNANAVILGISQQRFDPKTFWHEGSYVYEKYNELCTRLRYDLPTSSGSRPMVQQKIEGEDSEKYIRKWRLRESNPILPKYLEFFEEVEQLEHKLPDLPEIYLQATQIFPLVLSRPICIEKELLKWSHPDKWNWLVDNAHIAEEIGLLQKDLRILKEALETARRTGEKPVISR